MPNHVPARVSSALSVRFSLLPFLFPVSLVVGCASLTEGLKRAETFFSEPGTQESLRRIIAQPASPLTWVETAGLILGLLTAVFVGRRAGKKVAILAMRTLRGNNPSR